MVVIITAVDVEILQNSIDPIIGYLITFFLLSLYTGSWNAAILGKACVL